MRKLREWYAGHGPRGTGGGLQSCQFIGPYDDKPGSTVTIRRCYFEKDKSWFVTLAIGGFPSTAERGKPADPQDQRERRSVAAHELTHILLNGIAGGEHLTGGDERHYLMYHMLDPQRWGSFLFENRTRQNLGLKNKEFSRIV